MTTSPLPPIVSEAEWRSALDEQIAHEKAIRVSATGSMPRGAVCR